MPPSPRTLLVFSMVACIASTCVAEQPKRRAPSGFTGVRGKKSIADSSYSDTFQETAVDESLDKRAPSGFMGMRGKKPFPDPLGLAEDGMKRAPSGFMGMRGKKDGELDNLLDDYDKRAPSGFMGMRGKKLVIDDGDGYMSKKAPSGFMGMRGKKEYDDMVEEIKRAQMSGFFGMRGKKQPFGIRGKKYPYEFRGKFVGVRGKKMSNEVGDYGYLNGHLGNEQFAQLANNLDLNQLMLLLTENNGIPTENEYVEEEHV